MTKEYSHLINNLIDWGKSFDKLKALIVIGSQSRTEYHADEYSDLDMIMVADDPEYFLISNQWLENIGKYHISFVENTFAGLKERRILFEGALDVDFVIIPNNIINNVITDIDAMKIFGQGYTILLDKINLNKIFPQFNQKKSLFDMPSEQEFINIIKEIYI